MPSLIEKIYEDMKFGSKWLGKKGSKNWSSSNNKKKPRKKKEKKKEITHNEKIGYTIFFILFIPIFVLGFIWCQSSLLNTILLSGIGQAVKNLHMPTDKDCVPYSKDCDGKKKAAVNKTNNTSVFDLMNDLPKEKTQSGGRRKNKGKVQKGGALKTSFDKSFNDSLGFFNTQKYGFPYDLKENENLLFQDVANYFINIFSTTRVILVKVLEMYKESFYSNENSDPPESITDYIKFAFLLPILNTILLVGQPIASTISLLWSAISDQSPIGMGVFSIIAVISIITVIVYGFSIFVSGIASFWSPGFLLLVLLFTLFQFGAWPYGIMGPYLLTFLYKYSSSKFTLFKSYGRKYKMCWALFVIIGWFVSISSLWDWDKIAMIVSGGVPFAMWCLTALGLATTI